LKNVYFESQIQLNQNVELIGISNVIPKTPRMSSKVSCSPNKYEFITKDMHEVFFYKNSDQLVNSIINVEANSISIQGNTMRLYNRKWNFNQI